MRRAVRQRQLWRRRLDALNRLDSPPETAPTSPAAEAPFTNARRHTPRETARLKSCFPGTATLCAEVRESCGATPGDLRNPRDNGRAGTAAGERSCARQSRRATGRQEHECLEDPIATIEERLAKRQPGIRSWRFKPRRRSPTSLPKFAPWRPQAEACPTCGQQLDADKLLAVAATTAGAASDDESQDASPELPRS